MTLKTEQMEIRGFDIVNDVQKRFTPIDAICQFKYKGYVISISTAGRSQGACQNEVHVFDKEGEYLVKEGFHTVEKAIRAVDFKVDCPWLPPHKAGFSNWKLYNGDTCPIEDGDTNIYTMTYQVLKDRDIDSIGYGKAKEFDWSVDEILHEHHIAIYCYQLKPTKIMKIINLPYPCLKEKYEEPFEILESQKAQPGQGYDRYATKWLSRSQDRKYWTDTDNFHKYVIDDYGFLKYVGWQGQNN